MSLMQVIVNSSESSFNLFKYALLSVDDKDTGSSHL